jgi:hypothetical protein
MRLSTVGLLVAALAFLNPLTGAGQTSKEKREAAYQAALKSYSDTLKTGSTRKEVETYLGSKNTSFQTMCCIDADNAFSFLVKIGSEKHPWYCSEHNVYIALHFAASESGTSHSRTDSDKLTKITIYHWLEGCL